MHVDTGHNFTEVIEYRDRRVTQAGVQLLVASVQESIDAGRVVEETGRRASRNRLQTTTLLDAIEKISSTRVRGGPPGRREGQTATRVADLVPLRMEFFIWRMCIQGLMKKANTEELVAVPSMGAKGSGKNCPCAAQT